MNIGLIWDLIEALRVWWFVPPQAVMPDLPWVAKLTPGAAETIRQTLEATLRAGYAAGARDAGEIALPFGLIVGFIFGLRVREWVREARGNP